MAQASSKTRQIRKGAEPLDFEGLQLTPKPNQFLVAPEGLCREAEPHRFAPVYDLPAGKLRDGWLHMVAGQPRVSMTGLDEAALAYEFEQRSALLGFKDRISVRFIPLGPEKSTIAIYSRSRTGYYDFGVNQDRVETWLEELDGEFIR